jgi:hypothetical protein
MAQQDTEVTALSTDAVPRSPAAERMQRCRKRRRDGLRSLTTELRETEVDMLIRKGLLKTDARNDPGAICEALYVHLDRALRAAS